MRLGLQLIIGTYTERLPHVDGRADGILGARFDPRSGRFGEVGTLATARNPSYLALSPSGANLFSVCESATFEGRPGGGVVAFTRDPRTGALTRRQARGTGGEDPCHVTLAGGGRLLATANYGQDAGSVTVYPVTPGGGLGEAARHVRHEGGGPDAERQASSHAHMTAVDPGTGDLLVADLGADTIFVYSAEPAGPLTLRRELKPRPGTGPRHLAFHPDRRHLFVVGELDSTVSVWRRDAGGYTVTDAVPTLPEGGPGGGNLPAAVRVSPSGRHVLVSNRGHDSIAVFRFDPVASRLRLATVTAAGGRCPRDFILTPDGRRLVAALQDSDLLTSFEFDDETGVLRPLHRVAAPTPACLVLALLRALASCGGTGVTPGRASRREHAAPGTAPRPGPGARR